MNNKLFILISMISAFISSQAFAFSCIGNGSCYYLHNNSTTISGQPAVTLQYDKFGQSADYCNTANYHSTEDINPGDTIKFWINNTNIFKCEYAWVGYRILQGGIYTGYLTVKAYYTGGGEKEGWHYAVEKTYTDGSKWSKDYGEGINEANFY